MRIIKILPFLLLTCIILCGCGPSTKNLAEKNRLALNSEIQTLQYTLAKAEDATKDVAAAMQLIEKSQTYANTYPQDSLAPVYLFRAADVSRGIGRHDLAIELWGRVGKEFNSFRRAPEALFLQGFTCDRDLENADKARFYYQKFLETYPGHSLVSDVQLMLVHLDNEKSPQELIREFKRQNDKQ